MAREQHRNHAFPQEQSRLGDAQSGMRLEEEMEGQGLGVRC